MANLKTQQYIHKIETVADTFTILFDKLNYFMRHYSNDEFAGPLVLLFCVCFVN